MRLLTTLVNGRQVITEISTEEEIDAFLEKLEKQMVVAIPDNEDPKHERFVFVPMSAVVSIELEMT